MKLSILLKLVVGFFSLGLGAIGLFLPVWPTTPFVLLAVGCFSSTPAIQQRLLGISFVRDCYNGYTKRSGLAPKTVAISLGFLWGMLILSCILTAKVAVTVLLLLVGIAVTWHILWIAKAK